MVLGFLGFKVLRGFRVLRYLCHFVLGFQGYGVLQF